MPMLCSYRREFSKIAHIQKPHTLCYEAEKLEEGLVRFVLRSSGGELFQEELLLRGIGEACARDAMYYLYENAVPVQAWKEILTDTLQVYCGLPQHGEEKSCSESF